MTQEKLIDAITELDSDILDRYFLMKKSLTEKKKPRKNIWKAWTSIAACFVLICFTAIISGIIYIYPSIDSPGTAMDMAVIEYGPFIFVPILVVALINLYVFFTKHTGKTMEIVNAISLVTINILNVVGIYLYSQLAGINIFGNLPIILVSSNIGAIISIVSNILLDIKIKAWWKKLLLWLFVSAASITVACMVDNVILILFQGDMIMIA